MLLSVIFRGAEKSFPFVFEENRFCRRFSKAVKKSFRSFLRKNSSVGENQAEGSPLAVQITPTERENRKNERNLKCED